MARQLHARIVALESQQGKPHLPNNKAHRKRQ